MRFQPYKPVQQIMQQQQQLNHQLYNQNQCNITQKPVQYNANYQTNPAVENQSMMAGNVVNVNQQQQHYQTFNQIQSMHSANNSTPYMNYNAPKQHIQNKDLSNANHVRRVSNQNGK